MRTIEISEETYEKIKDQFGQELFKDLTCLDDMIGEKWFFRTVTYHMVGRVTQKMGNFFVLEDASWVADSGRFMNAIKEGELDEVEPVGKAILNIDAIVDAFPWKHQLPSEQK